LQLIVVALVCTLPRAAEQDPHWNLTRAIGLAVCKELLVLVGMMLAVVVGELKSKAT